MKNKSLVFRILTYSLISIVIVTAFWKVAELQDSSKFRATGNNFILTPTDNPLGNVLSSYFYYTNAAPAKDIIPTHINASLLTKNPELKEFYAKLDWTHKKRYIAYESADVEAWSQLKDDGSLKENYLKYWQEIRPVVDEFYLDTLKTNAIEIPVIHFRCSDSPFNKHKQYHMTKAATAKWMAEQVKSRGFDRAILLSCNQHRSLDQKSCQQYTRFYAKIFMDAGIIVKTQCNDIMQDFAMMVYSPVLVSLNTSSFSFMAGIAKDPNNYISCNMGMERDGKYIHQTEADWILSQDEPLLHKNVQDYNDAIDVISKLKQ